MNHQSKEALTDDKPIFSFSLSNQRTLSQDEEQTIEFARRSADVEKKFDKNFRLTDRRRTFE